MSENQLVDLSRSFAVEIIGLSFEIKKRGKASAVVNQLLRSGTSIGANVSESAYAQTKADFKTKMYIALKEASESAYWIELLERTEYLTAAQAKSIRDDCQELIKILSSITKTTKERKG